MKRSLLSIIGSLVIVLGLSFLIGFYIKPLLSFKTYSETSCLNDQITDEMDLFDIAKLYRDSNATVEVKVTATFTQNSKDAGIVYGSGVAVASKGYATTGLDTAVVANRGSYFATNYHVIDRLDDPTYKNAKIYITTEEEVDYPCSLLWFDKDLDLAIIYSDNVNVDYVRMVDRSITCEKSEKLDYETIFTIGTPLDPMFLNRLTIGNVASNNDLVFATSMVIYPYESGGSMKYYTQSQSAFASGVAVLNNIYEDVIDVSLGITPGNSGGGCFDANGNLIGLTTLGVDVSETGGNQMNGVVPIYPVMQVLDRVIANNELNKEYKIISINNLGFVGVDAEEAYNVSYIKNDVNYSYYFIDGNFFDSDYDSDFSFTQEGYYILSSQNALYGLDTKLSRGSIITSIEINNGGAEKVEDRNDLIYSLYNIKDGDSVKITYTSELGGILGLTQSYTIQF